MLVASQNWACFDYSPYTYLKQIRPSGDSSVRYSVYKNERDGKRNGNTVD